MPRWIGRREGRARRQPLTSWGWPIFARGRRGASLCWPDKHGAIASGQNCWQSPRTCGGDGTRTWPNTDAGWQGGCADTSPITPCQPTHAPCRLSATMSSISGVAPCAGAARGTGRPGATWTGWPRASCPDPGSPIPGPSNASASNTQGGSRMRESRPYGSVRGACSNARPYRDRVLGGSSSINGLVYIRGQAQDFDHWRQLGNTGWGADDVLPYFRKAEDNERGADALHGAGGPLGVSDLRDQHPLAAAYVEAAQQCGYPRNDDFNGAQQEGAGFYQTTTRGGVRSSTAVAYLAPARHRNNLKVVPEALATRILF